MLEDEAEMARSQRGELPVAEAPGAVAVQQDLADGGRVEGAHEVQQGGLARPGCPDDGQCLAAAYPERDMVQRGHWPWVGLGDVAQFDRRGHGDHAAVTT